MKKNKKNYIYDVEEYTIKDDNSHSASIHNYFSTYDKAVAYLEWSHSCAENNGGAKVKDNFFNTTYNLPSGEVCVIKCERRMLDSFYMDEV